MPTETIDTEPDALQDVLQGLLDDLETEFKDIDYTAMLTDYMGELETAHLDYFLGQHDPVGVAWPPLAKSTVKAKGDDTILFDTGAMMDSLVDQTSDSIKLVYREGMSSEAYLVFGTMVEYAHWHMTGTSKMPARPFIGMNETLLTQLQEATADATVAALITAYGGSK